MWQRSNISERQQQEQFLHDEIKIRLKTGEYLLPPFSSQSCLPISNLRISRLKHKKL